MSGTIVEPRPGRDMGRVTVEVLVENYGDVDRAARGDMEPERVRRLTVEALVDTGATYLSLPKSLIEQLGLIPVQRRRVRIANGVVERQVFATAQMTVQGRDCRGDIMELPEDCTPLLGQLALESMDWWVDLTNRRLVGNPEHGGEWISEAY